MRIGCLGMTTIDTLLFTKTLPVKHDDLSRVDDYVTCLGGKGMITALTLFMLGCDVALFTLAGQQKSFQDEVMGLLPGNFCTDYIQPWLLRNNRTWITVSSQQEVYTLVNPSPVVRVPGTLIKERIAEFIEGLDLLYISTEYVPVLKEATRVAARVNLPVVSNLNTPLLADPSDGDGRMLRSLVDVSSTVIVNETEAAQALAKLDVTTWADIKSPPLSEVIVTKAGQGGLMSVRPFHTWEKYKATIPTEVSCVVGAGDTFNGAYIKARFMDGISPVESCKYASEIASRKVSVRSSTLHLG